MSSYDICPHGLCTGHPGYHFCVDCHNHLGVMLGDFENSKSHSEYALRQAILRKPGRSIQDRIEAIEKAAGLKRPRTKLRRCKNPSGRINDPDAWCLSVGEKGERKQYFIDQSIELALRNAEQYYGVK